MSGELQDVANAARPAASRVDPTRHSPSEAVDTSLPRLGVDQDLNLKLQVSKPTEEERRGTRTEHDGVERDPPVFWLTELVSTYSPTLRNHAATSALEARYRAPCSIAEREAFRTALDLSIPDLEELRHAARAFFGCVQHDAGREPGNDRGDRSGGSDWDYDYATSHGVRALLFDSGARFEKAYGYIRYDPERLLHGLLWMAELGERLAETSPWHGRLASEARAVSDSEFIRELATLITSYDPSFSMPERGDIAAIFRDSGRSVITNSEGTIDTHDWDGDRIDRTKEEYFADGMINYPESRDRDWREPRDHFSCLVRSLGERHADDVTRLLAVVDEFEYLLTWARIQTEAPGYASAPEVATRQDAVTVLQGVRNPVLLHTLGAEGAVPSDLLIDDRPVQITGPNASGKTQMVGAVMSLELQAHRGLPGPVTTSRSMPLSTLWIGLNESATTDTMSAFQTEMTAIGGVLRQLAARADAGERVALFLDEPGRGTDMRSAVPLIAAIGLFCERHGIRIVFTTHFQDVSKAVERLEVDGYSVQAIRMTSEHRAEAGVGTSDGIRAAAQRGLQPEIIAIAEQVQRDTPTLDRFEAPRTAASMTAAPVIARPDAYELEILKAPTRRNGENLGRATAEFANCSPFSRSSGLREPERPFSGEIVEDFAADFVSALMEPLDSRGRAVRANVIERIQDRILTDDWANTHHGEIAPLIDFPLIARVERELPPSFQELGNERADRDARREANTAGDRLNEDGPELIVNAVVSICSQARDMDLGSIDERLAPLMAFDQSGAFSAMRDFLDERRTLPSAYSETTGSEWQAWRDWCAVCREHATEIQEFKEAVGLYNFYFSTAWTCLTEGWTRVEPAEAGTLAMTGVRNTALEGAIGHGQVDAVDLLIHPDQGIVGISGENGGGKTRATQATGLATFFATQLGFAPAQSADSGSWTTITCSFNSGTHSDTHSAFENEVDRITRILTSLEARGAGVGTLLLLDEPFKGTAEVDAVPLLIGLCTYCAERSITLQFTTHYASFFDAIRRYPGLADKVLALHVNSSQDDGEQYRLRPGAGPSLGIDVAERAGMIPEVIGYAREFQRRLTEESGVVH